MRETCSTCSNKGKLQELGDLETMFILILPEILEDLGTIKLCAKCKNVLKQCSIFRENALNALMKQTQIVSNGDSKIPKNKQEPSETKSAANVKIEHKILEGLNFNSCDPLSDDDCMDDDDDDEVLSNVKMKMNHQNLNNPTSLNSKESKIKVKRKSKTEISGKETNKCPETVFVDLPSFLPTNDEIIAMFTSIEFCKNKFDVDGNHVEVLLLSQQELSTRRVALREWCLAVGDVFCDTCLIAFDTQSSLESHRRINHVEQPNEIKCPICQTYVPPQMFKHHYGKHMVIFRCQICLFVESNPIDILKHLKCHSDGKLARRRYNCTICNINHVNSRSLRLHREKVHNLDKNEYECKPCNKKFEYFTHYKEHQKRHEEKPIPCKECGKTYLSSAALSYHRLSHSTDSTEAAYCVECDTQYKNVLLYKIHLRNHSRHRDPNGSQLHWCAECGKSFPQKKALRDHIAINHLKLKNFKCGVCDKSFGRANTLRQHRRTAHEGAATPRNKLCSYCGRGFATKRMLADHTNTHTGERPFKCDKCGDTFRQSAALFTHRRLVHMKIKSDRRRVIGDRQHASGRKVVGDRQALELGGVSGDRHLGELGGLTCDRQSDNASISALSSSFQ